MKKDAKGKATKADEREKVGTRRCDSTGGPRGKTSDGLSERAVENPMQALAGKTIALMERIKDLLLPYTDDEAGYWMDGGKLVEMLQDLIRNARERNEEIFDSFIEAGGKIQGIVERMFNETECCLDRIGSFLEIFRHESVKARLTGKEVTPESNALEYVTLALIRDAKFQLTAISHIAATGKVPLDGVEYDTEVELCA